MRKDFGGTSLWGFILSQMYSYSWIHFGAKHRLVFFIHCETFSREVMEGLKNNCVRKQMDKWMDRKSIRDVEYKYVNKALRLCLGVLGKSVNYRLQGRYTQGGITLSDSLPQLSFSLGICS